MDISNEVPEDDQTVPDEPVSFLDVNVNNLEVISKAGFQIEASSLIGH